MRSYRKLFREDAWTDRIMRQLQDHDLMRKDTMVLGLNPIIYPSVRVIEQGEPFAILDRYADVYGEALPLWQMIDDTRYFGHIGYHMYFARKRFSRTLVDHAGNVVVRNKFYQPAIPYELDAWYKWQSAKVTQHFLTNFKVYSKVFGTVPLVLTVQVETTTHALGINMKMVTNNDNRLVSDPPQHERLQADDWKIWGQHQRYRQGELGRFEYEGLVYG